MSVRDNINVMVSPRDAHAGGILDGRHAAQRALDAIRQLSIRVASPQVNVGSLSGGNQQKVLLARLLEMSPSVLILDEPTRGVDIGAKSEIYRLIDELASRGIAVLVISSELAEVVGICDRVLVMREGASPARSAARAACRSPRKTSWHWRRAPAWRTASRRSPCTEAAARPATKEQNHERSGHHPCGLHGRHHRRPAGRLRLPATGQASARSKEILRALGMLPVLVLLCIGFSLASEDFASLQNLSIVTQQASINIVLAAGMTFVILTGGIDLSVGSILAASAMAAMMVSTSPAWACSASRAGWARGCCSGWATAC